MAKQIMVSDEVHRILDKLKDEFNLRSYSEVIKMLYASLPKDEYSVINQAFEDLKSKIAKYFDDFEILEMTRIFYLKSLGISNSTVEEAKGVLRSAFQKAWGILHKSRKM